MRFGPTFTQGESISLAQVDRLELQYTYVEGDTFFFMDTSTFEEVTMDAKSIGDKAGFIREGMNLEVNKRIGDDAPNADRLVACSKIDVRPNVCPSRPDSEPLSSCACVYVCM